jgi:histidyl-tRNA synthetase
MRAHLCDACGAHHAAVLAGLDALGVPYRENPLLVRGLDYYTRTAFEVHYAALGAQSALGGGGRYDGLVELVGGPPTPAVGFSSGLERILVALEQSGAGRSVAAPPRAAVLVLPLGETARRRALALARVLRGAAATQVDLTGRALKGMLRAADRTGARVAVILGDQELARGVAVVRDLGTGEQAEHPEDQIAAAVRRALRPRETGERS